MGLGRRPASAMSLHLVRRTKKDCDKVSSTALLSSVVNRVNDGVACQLANLLCFALPILTRTTGQPHTVAGYEQRSIAEGSITITIGGNKLELGKQFGLLVGQEYDVTISKPTPFKGIMARLSGGDADIDTSTVFNLGDDGLLRLNTEFCDGNVSRYHCV